MKCIRLASLLGEVRLYDLRRTFATLPLCFEINPKVISERLGRVNIRITFNIYARVLQDIQPEALGRREYSGFRPVCVSAGVSHLNISDCGAGKRSVSITYLQ